MSKKETDIKIGGRFWSTSAEGKIIDASQIDGLDGALEINLENGTGSGGVEQKDAVWTGETIFDGENYATKPGDVVKGAEAKGFQSFAIGGYRYNYAGYNYIKGGSYYYDIIGHDPLVLTRYDSNGELIVSATETSGSITIDETTYLVGKNENGLVTLTNGSTVTKETKSGSVEDGRTPTSAEGNQSFAGGASCHAYGDWDMVYGHDSKTYQLDAFAFGGGLQAGFTEDEFNAYFWDAEKGVALHDGKGLKNGKVTNQSGSVYEKSYIATITAGMGNKNKSWCGAVFGSGNKVEGTLNLVGGANNTISAACVLGEGQGNTIKGSYTIINGNLNTSNAAFNTINGRNVIVNGEYNMITGFNIKASGSNNMITGKDHADISGSYSFIGGNNNTVKGVGDVVVAANSTVKGEYSGAIGLEHTVEGSYAFTAGARNIVNNTSAIALGQGLTTGVGAQVVVGINNEVNSYARFIVGVGSGDTKKNGFWVDADGRCRCYYTSHNQDNELTSKAYVDNKISTLIGAAPETLNTLEEIASWIEEDKTGTAALVEQVNSKVSDVQVNGASIVANNIANIRVNAVYGTGFSSGYFAIAPATEAEVRAKQSNRKPIVPAQIDLALVHSLGKNSKASEMTAEMRANARNLIGLVAASTVEIDALFA